MELENCRVMCNFPKTSFLLKNNDKIPILLRSKAKLPTCLSQYCTVYIVNFFLKMYFNFLKNFIFL